MLPSLSAITHQALPTFRETLGRLQPSVVSTLGNGFRIASQQTPSETCTVGVWVDAGSRDETAATSGVAHFWEHMTFKGTTRRSKADIERTIEKIGAHLNAYTTRENTAFYIRCFKKDVPVAVDLLGDVLRNSTVSAEAVESERHTILEEMQDVDSKIEEVLMEHVHRQAFETDSLGYPILGPAENIQKKITREAILDFVRNNYTGPRMVLVGAGDIDHNQLAELGDRHFGSVPKDPAARQPYSRYVGGIVREFNENIPWTHLVAAFRTDGYGSEHEVPLMVLQHIWGSYSKEKGDTPLTALARRLAVAHDIAELQPFYAPYRGVGLMGVYAKLYPERHGPQLSYAVTDRFEEHEGKHIHGAEICNELMYELIRPGVKTDDDEVTRAKNALKAATLMNLTNTATTADDLGKQLLFAGRHKPLVEFFKEIDAVNTYSLQAAATKYLYDRDPTIGCIGDVVGIPNYHWWRRYTYMLRN